MLISKASMDRIDQLVEDAYLMLALNLLGYSMISSEQRERIDELRPITRTALWLLLYRIIRLRPEEGYHRTDTIQNLLDEAERLSGNLIVNDTHIHTLEHGLQAMNEVIENTKADIKKRLRAKILEANRSLRQELAVQRMRSLDQKRKQEQKELTALIAALAGIKEVIQTNFDSAFTSVLTDYINDATMDRITAQSVISGRNPEDAVVFKTVKNDGNLCQWCRKFYVDADGEPVLFSLKQLQANGTNDGKPKSQWKPVVGKTHPKCRCQLRHAPAVERFLG